MLLHGHWEAFDSLLPILDTKVERHIMEYGVTDFVVGRYGRFDGMALRCVKALKKCHPEVTFTLLLPYHPYDYPTTPTLPGFDGMFYSPGMETVPKRAAIIRVNRYMIEHSDHLIAYAWHSVNALDLVEYAYKRQRKGLIEIVSLNDI